MCQKCNDKGSIPESLTVSRSIEHCMTVGSKAQVKLRMNPQVEGPKNICMCLLNFHNGEGKAQPFMVTRETVKQLAEGLLKALEEFAFEQSESELQSHEKELLKAYREGWQAARCNREQSNPYGNVGSLSVSWSEGYKDFPEGVR